MNWARMFILFSSAIILVANDATAKDETYRLIHAIGNTERESARNLTKAECEKRKKELKAVGESLGIHNEKAGIGSIVCLPESFF